MFFRFVATLAIMTGISIFGMNLEKQNLKLKRIISSQHYELHSLEENRSRLYLQTQELGAPPKLLQNWEQQEKYVASSRRDASDKETRESPPPLLEWRLRSDTERNK